MLLLAVLSASASTAYVRFPDIHGDLVVLNAGGDLWLTDLGTRVSRPLTSHSGDEMFPQFSADGSMVAFTGFYDGNPDVYVVPVAGGQPRRLTWGAGTDEVLSFLPDGRVLFRNRDSEPHYEWELFAVSPEGGEATKLPIGFATRLAADPTTGLWAFDRSDRERADWKRYRGGTNNNIWVGDPKKNDFKMITDFSGLDAFPMWHEGRIYFLSDRGGTADLWSMLPDGTDAKRLTNGGQWDARYPSMGPDGRIVYMRAGDLGVFDPATGKDQVVQVDVPGERTLTRERYPDPSPYISWFELSPNADRLAMVVRGDVWSIPTDDGVSLPVVASSGARESWASFSPDGKRMVYVTDESGEEAIVTADAWGRGKTQTVLPPGTSGWHFAPTWSPDGKQIAWADQTNTLYVAPASGGTVRRVDQSEQWEITSYTWSADGRWLAYDKVDRMDMRHVHVWDTVSGKATQVTRSTTDDHAPAWDPDGRYLYFVGERFVNPLIAGRDFETITGPSSMLYAVLLRKDVENPVAARVGVPEEEAPLTKEKRRKKKSREKSEGAAEGPTPVTIEIDGLQDRFVELPVEPGLYDGLTATSEQVFFLSHPLEGIAEEPEWASGEHEANGMLLSYSLHDKEASMFVEGILGYTLARGGEKLAYAEDMGTIYVVPVDSPPEDPGDPVDLSGIVLEVDPAAEWHQMFVEGWRHMRDFFWEPTMSGLDWKAIRDQYATLLPRVGCREELADLMGEMIGELATSHTYIWGGDPGRDVPYSTPGLLGADVTRAGDAFQVTRIYHGDPADRERSPLSEPGSEVAEGEYILEVNHEAIPKDRPFLSAFENLVDHPVVLTVNSTPTTKGARSVVVTPIPDDHALRYVDWVRTNREYVSKMTAGKMGYIHLPDMDTEGLVDFFTWFFPQLDKEGLVVDVRWNGGGYVSQLVLERLRRRVLSLDRSRGGGIWTYPTRTLNGPFVVITNEYAGSDGDIFPKAVQLEKLAPVIGERSWGGVVGIRADKLLVDQGMLTQPEFAGWYPQGGWIVENHGVDPDIVVQNLPQDVAAGKDPQLDRAIQELLRLRAEHPPVTPEFGPVPNKTRAAFGDESK